MDHVQRGVDASLGFCLLLAQLFSCVIFVSLSGSQDHPVVHVVPEPSTGVRPDKGRTQRGVRPARERRVGLHLCGSEQEETRDRPSAV